MQRHKNIQKGIQEHKKSCENIQKDIRGLSQRLKQLTTEHANAVKQEDEQKNIIEALRLKYKNAWNRVEALEQLIKLREDTIQTNTPEPKIAPKTPQNTVNSNRNSVQGRVVQNNGPGGINKPKKAVPHKQQRPTRTVSTGRRNSGAPAARASASAQRSSTIRRFPTYLYSPKEKTILAKNVYTRATDQEVLAGTLVTVVSKSFRNGEGQFYLVTSEYGESFPVLGSKLGFPIGTKVQKYHKGQQYRMTIRKYHFNGNENLYGVEYDGTPNSLYATPLTSVHFRSY